MPIGTLLTDFGTRDPYVGVMKGVILSRCPAATLVDLTHSVSPQNVLEGAYYLESAWRYFPEGTVHLCVVDPGVGTLRSAIAFEYAGHRFVGPDNGLFSLVAQYDVPTSIVDLDPELIGVTSMSTTFHGRDLFAPAVGLLLTGVPISSIGMPRNPPVLCDLDIPVVTVSGEQLIGQVVLIDHYGNCLTNIRRKDIPVGYVIRSVSVGEITVRDVVATYGASQPNRPIALFSSMDTLEIAIRNGSAERELEIVPGLQVIAWLSHE
jgi:S-adenosyl-L-methionine hydrolase (adenosine-forming)